MQPPRAARVRLSATDRAPARSRSPRPAGTMAFGVPRKAPDHLPRHLLYAPVQDMTAATHRIGAEPIDIGLALSGRIPANVGARWGRSTTAARRR
jgi:hypothetical protein